MKTSALLLYRRFLLAGLAATPFVLSGSLCATTYTWDGGDAASLLWGNANNWNPDAIPTFDTTADLTFNVLAKPSNYISAARTVRSITYGANITSAFQTGFITFNGGTAVNLTMQADVGNATITVNSGATGDITLGNVSGSTGTNGSMVLASNLDVVHNGTGLLIINRPISGTGFGITKTGTGTMQFSANNTFTGAVNINGGTLIANSFSTTGADLNAASAINLGGGTLQIGASSGTNKDYATVALNVNSASTLAYGNVNATTFTASFSGTAAFALNADLAIKNVSSNTTLTNAFNIGRSITGSGNITVETYNNIASSASSYSLGRVLLNGDNSAWTGNLTIAKGTASLGGTVTTSSGGSGGIIIGTTADSFGAALNLAANSPTVTGTQTVAKNITIRSGGFRSINGASDNSYILSGNIALEGNLNVNNALFFTDKIINFTGNITGVGALDVTKTGSGESIRLSGTNTYTGGTTISSGNLYLGNNGTTGSLSTTGAIVNNGTFTIYRSNAVVQGTDFSGAAITGTGAVTQAGSGTTTLNAANTYTGATTISNGTLSVSASNNLGGAASNLVFNGGTLQITGTALTNFSGIGHTVSFTAAKNVGLDISNAANTFTVDQVLNQTTGGFTKWGAGTVILNQANTYTGATTINAGTLAFGASNVLATGTAITLGGGSLNLGGFSQAAFTTALTMTTGSTIDFGAHVTGLTLKFADSSAATWTGSLALLNFAVGTDNLSFTSVTGLSVTQLGQISLAGYTATGLDASGNVQFTASAVPEPSTFALLGGMAAIAVTGLRRRRQAG